jgi:hypothetical protein
MYVHIYIYVFLMFNTHWLILMQLSGRTENYAATIVPFRYTWSPNQDTPLLALWSAELLTFFLVSQKKKEFNDRFIHLEGLESLNTFSSLLNEIITYVILKTKLPCLGWTWLCTYTVHSAVSQ